MGLFKTLGTAYGAVVGGPIGAIGGAVLGNKVGEAFDPSNPGAYYQDKYPATRGETRAESEALNTQAQASQKEIVDQQMKGTEQASSFVPSQQEMQRQATARGGDTGFSSDALAARSKRIYEQDINKLRRTVELQAPAVQADRLHKAVAVQQAIAQSDERRQAILDTMDANRRAARNQVLGSILGAAGAIGGTIVGGPMGGQAGYQAGSGMAGSSQQQRIG